MTSNFLVIPRPILTCTGCIHEFPVRGEMRCDLGERRGARCSKYKIEDKK